MNSLHGLAVLLAVSCMLLTMIIAWKSNILKENGDDSKYSFSKFQLLLWTLIILPAFILNWAYYKDFDNPDIGITELVLLGISSSSTVTAQIIKTAHLNAKSEGRLSKEEGLLLKSIAKSNNFWRDIFTDDSQNFSISRLQNFLFTIVFIFVYVTIFFNKSCEYPVFEQNAYILMGISTGGFLIAKGNRA